MDGHHRDICVIGGGMAGLACAAQLAQSGARVTVLDKGRGPGGRMAARRVEIGGETVSFDHGAQYFTARDPAFRAQVAAWAQAGVVAPWPAAGVDAWVGVPGMNAPVKAMAEPLEVTWNARTEQIVRDGTRWLVRAGERLILADTVLVAVPAEQAAVLLAEVAPDLAMLAAGVESAPCWAVMAGFAERLPVASDVVRSETGPVAWAARNSAKPGRGGREAWVIHASAERSRAMLDWPKEQVAAALLSDFFVATGSAPAAPLHCDAHRWLYALPQVPQGEGAHFDAAAGIGIAGDYLSGPRVEGAWLSGRTLAARVLAAG